MQHPNVWGFETSRPHTALRRLASRQRYDAPAPREQTGAARPTCTTETVLLWGRCSGVPRAMLSAFAGHDSAGRRSVKLAPTLGEGSQVGSPSCCGRCGGRLRDQARGRVCSGRAGRNVRRVGVRSSRGRSVFGVGVTRGGRARGGRRRGVRVVGCLVRRRPRGDPARAVRAVRGGGFRRSLAGRRSGYGAHGRHRRESGGLPRAVIGNRGNGFRLFLRFCDCPTCNRCHRLQPRGSIRLHHLLSG